MVFSSLQVLGYPDEGASGLQALAADVEGALVSVAQTYQPCFQSFEFPTAYAAMINRLCT